MTGRGRGRRDEMGVAGLGREQRNGRNQRCGNRDSTSFWEALQSTELQNGGYGRRGAEGDTGGGRRLR